MSNIFDSMLSGEASEKNPQGSDAQNENDQNNKDEAETPVAVTASPTETSHTPSDVKEVTQELLRHGHIDETRKAALFQKAMIHSAAIRAALEPLDLSLQLDEHRGVAFLAVKKTDNGKQGDGGQSDGGQEWSHPLVRRQRLTLEQSLLVAILRQAFVAHEQEAGVGEGAARVAVEDLLPQFLTYFEDSGSDAKNESRLMNILDQLKTHGIISEVDKKQEVTIRPLIAHLADPASLTTLLQSLQDQADQTEMDGFGDAFNSTGESDDK
jgi:hypothetical protein